MLLHRRHVVGLLGLAAAAPGLGALAPARADSADPRTSQRAQGDPNAPVKVVEYFSLTCTHCAAFAQETYPQVRKNLIDTGRVFYIFRDFPLDQVALTAAMVARALPQERYEPFILSLFASQDRWAFARGVNSTEELAKMAALAGMPRDVFDRTINDDALKQFVIGEEDEAQSKYKVDSTPSFIVNGPKEKDGLHPGEMGYDAFAAIIKKAAG
jgi:protein-disulfide isomerase